MTAPAPAGTLERGSTSLSDRVVDKIAARAALEVDHVHGVSSGLIAGVFHAQTTVGVTSAIDGQLAQLTLQVEVDYPASLAHRHPAVAVATSASGCGSSATSP